MRILKLRFKNLNSLVGEWLLDLTHQDYLLNGIFAITGPTGSGKSTILDAITLALYGRTPRLNKVTKSENEIMSRQTGECLSEVVFETNEGQYAVVWSQHRSRRSPAGELQNPKHELFDVKTSKVLAHSINNVATLVEKLTGMSFEQFTRTMLLAQGEFAKFLKASADERAPILEQITGTEIYSEISVKVHERKGAEAEVLRSLKAEVDFMQILAPDEEGALMTDLETKKSGLAAMDTSIENHSNAKSWLELIAKLERELLDVGARKVSVTERIDAFAPNQARLNAAGQALELSAEFSGLTSLRQAQEKETLSHKELSATLPGLNVSEHAARTELATALNALSLRKGQRETLHTILIKVRELDLKIASKSESITALTQSIKAIQSELNTLSAKQITDIESLSYKRSTQAELSTALLNTQADKQLISSLGAIHQRIDTIANLDLQIRTHQHEAAKIRSLINHADHQLQLLQVQTRKTHAARASIEASMKTSQTAFNTTLEGSELAAWRKTVTVLTARGLELSDLSKAITLASASTLGLTQAAVTRSTLQDAQLALVLQLQTFDQRQQTLDSTISLFSTQRMLLQTIKSMEEQRRHLADGKPCALCGSLDHPYAHGNMPDEDDADKNLNAASEALRILTDARTAALVKQAQNEKDLCALASSEEVLHVQLEAAQTIMQKVFADPEIHLGGVLAIDTPNLDERVCTLKLACTSQADRAMTIVSKAESLEAQLATLRISLDSHAVAATQAERQEQQVLNTKQLTEQQLRATEDATAGLVAEKIVAACAIRTEVAAFSLGIDESIVDFTPVLSALTSKRDLWVERVAQAATLTTDMSVLHDRTEHQATRISQLTQDAAESTEIYDGVVSARSGMVKERTATFGEKDPEKERVLSEQAVISAEQAYELSSLQANSAIQLVTHTQAKIDALSATIQARSQPLDQANEDFAMHRMQSGFDTENAFTTALLSEEDRKDLLERSNMLLQERAMMNAKDAELNTAVTTEKSRRLTEQTFAQVQADLLVSTHSRDALQSEIGGTQQKLTDNNQKKMLQNDKMNAILSQGKECVRWDALHQLIGSVDGKKYRNFAQGLTFEIMVKHANRQLEQMTDRYTLVRSPAQPLDLNVIDSYQSGEIRSTKNLSGGESFIVSLALALGLSHMVSKNVRVDSLFLDEGFGTLDEDALDTALQTLMGLQQGGKLIGVISHISALKDRISTQIQVTPRPGGRSTISGPGCERVGMTLAA